MALEGENIAEFADVLYLNVKNYVEDAKKYNKLMKMKKKSFSVN